jgi:prohibitin 2
VPKHWPPEELTENKLFQLTDRARDFNIILDDVAITDLSFGHEYAAAVEAKQVKCR